MGRPPADNPRTEIIRFRVTPDEAAEIDRRRDGRTISEWVRSRLFGGD